MNKSDEKGHTERAMILANSISQESFENASPTFRSNAQDSVIPQRTIFQPILFSYSPALPSDANDSKFDSKLANNRFLQISKEL